MCFIFQALTPTPEEEPPELSDVEDTDVETASPSEDTDSKEEAPNVAGVPKIIGHYAINDCVDNVRVFNVFYNHLFSMDGGSRPKEVSKENMRKVGHLLYEIDEELNVNQLWDAGRQKKKATHITCLYHCPTVVLQISSRSSNVLDKSKHIDIDQH